MPAYISHAIMMEEVFKETNNNHKVFPLDVNLDELKTFSLGIDLASLAPLKENPHRMHTQDFFLYMISYIKNYQLVNDPHVMALLYGHVAHYFFDLTAHPFIYAIDLNSIRSSFIPNHHLIEGYLDSYLTNKILHLDIMDINEKYFGKANFENNKVKEVLNKTFGKIYGNDKISNYYRDTLELFILLEKVCKSGLFSKADLIIISKFKNFLKLNHLQEDDLNNEKMAFYINVFDGASKNNSFLELFYHAVYLTEIAFIEINRVLYENKNFDILESIFKDLSYDTGLLCNEGFHPKYLKK